MNDHAAARQPLNWAALLALLLSIAALAVALVGRNGARVPNAGTSTLDQIKRTRVMRIGYEGYAPYVQLDPKSNLVSGYAVDLANAIAKEAGWRVQWVKTTPDTKINDLKAAKFDLMVEPIFATIPRAASAAFTQPYTYFGYGAGIVRTSENRFNALGDLNARRVRIVVRLGYTDQQFADDHFPLADRRALNVSDIGQLFAEVTENRADIALANVDQVKAFAATHPSVVRAVFADPPPAAVPAAFMIREGDSALQSFLNASIDYLRANGVFKDLDERYKIDSQHSARF